MDNLETKIEGGINKIIAEFEAKPIATSIKGVVIILVLKQLIKFFKS